MASFEEQRDFKLVRSAVYLLRTGGVRPSAAKVQSILAAAFGRGMRKQDICAHMKRLLGNRPIHDTGTAREPNGNYSGTTFEHDGNRTGTIPEHRARDKNKEYEYKNDGTAKKTTPVLRAPNPGEEEVLAICYDWERGIPTPMPSPLVELYRAMRPVHNLPARPGT